MTAPVFSQPGKKTLFALMTTMMVLLTGCAQVVKSPSGENQAQAYQPEQQLADYLTTRCADIWHWQDNQTLENPLYWLRAMDCAGRLTPADARQQARQWSALTWQDTFKRGILLSTAKITPVERRRYMTDLDMMATDIPLHVRSLFILWRDGQRSLLNLAEERSRYSKLQQTTDSELDELREKQQQLRNQLELTTRKLENLTDIERQLSTRKPGNNDIPESRNNPDNDVITSPTTESTP